MPSPAAFWPEALPYAQQVHADMPEMFVSVVLAQWAAETGYGGPDWYLYNNPGNVGDPAAGGQTQFPTLEAGVQQYMVTLKLGYYVAVRAATNWQAQCYALGNSPWAAGRYIANGVPGELLIEIIQSNNLTQYDGTPPPPPPPPPPVFPKESNMMCESPNGGQWVVRANAAVYAFNGAPYLGPLTKYTQQWGIGTPQNPVVGICPAGDGGFMLATDNGGPEPAVYHITADAQYAH